MFKGKIIMKKKTMLLVIFMVGVLSLGGCGAKQPDLKEKGLEMIALMDEKASNEKYAEALSVGEDWKEAVIQFGEGEYTTPSRVFEIKFPANRYLEKMGADLSGMSETLKEELYNQTNYSLSTVLNEAEGVKYIVASSVIIGTTAFEGKLESPVIYLYQFGDKGNAAMISFIPAEENVIIASSTFLASEELNNMETEEEIQDFLSLNMGGVEGIEVTALN